MMELFKRIFWNFFEIFKWLFTSELGISISIILGVFSFLLYFRSFKRLVYSFQSNQIISEELKLLENLSFSYLDEKIENLYLSNLIIYNNGRKSINQDDISELSIRSENSKIFDVLKLNENNNAEATILDNTVKIELDKFDSNNYVVFRIFHESQIKLDSRIKETGEILHTEPTGWKILHLILIIFWWIFLFYSSSKIEDGNIMSYEYISMTLVMGIMVFIFLRIIHSFFFIPDRITSKYLDLNK